MALWLLGGSWALLKFTKTVERCTRRRFISIKSGSTEAGDFVFSAHAYFTFFRSFPKFRLHWIMLLKDRCKRLIVDR